MDHWHGLFRIFAKCSPLHFKLRICDSRLVSVTVHANRMKPYYDLESCPKNPPNQDVPTDPPIPENELLDHSQQNGKNSNAVQQSTDNTAAKVHDLVYNIERVLKTRNRNNKKQFLIKWKGYGSENN